jgi:hypothetical protein
MLLFRGGGGRKEDIFNIFSVYVTRSWNYKKGNL